MSHTARSCASCGETACAMHKLHGVAVTPAERSAWLLDDVWPETASMVAALSGPQDQLLAPGIAGPRPARHAWPGRVRHPAVFATLRRHWAMRRVAQADGATRQRTYLGHDRAIAHRLAREIDYRARHLVVAQVWLPWLEETGVLGGRTYDVVMSRYPLADIHRLLDAAAAEMNSSRTIADFRADADLVEREARLLARARRIITPHHGIAALFGTRALRLVWHRPAPVARRPGTRTAFLGPTIARARPDIARQLAGSGREPLIVFGRVIEPGFWEGANVEYRRLGPGWLDGIGTIVHPAVFTPQPRLLLQALAAGVAIHATPEAGLAAGDYLPIGGLPQTGYGVAALTR